jgi:hypothetical protein
MVPFFCVVGHVFRGAECVGSRFHILRARNGFGGPEGDGSRFHVFRAGTMFRRNGWRRVPFSCFARPDSFSAIPRVSGRVFLFSATRVVSRVTEGVKSRFHVLRSRTRFRRFRERRVPFSCFLLPDIFSAVPSAAGPVFMFCVPGLIFGGTKGVGSRFLVLRSRTRFQRYGGRRVPFYFLRARTRFRRKRWC